MRPGTGDALLRSGPAARLGVAAEALEVGAEFGSTLIAHFAVLLECLAENVLHRQREASI